MKSDAQLQSAVSDELAWDSRLEGAEIGVQVHSGVVTLTGTVDVLAKRVAAQEAAHRVAGVTDVANDVRVREAPAGVPTDTQIALAVRHALEWCVLVPHAKIRSTVDGGHVTLEGEVEFLSQRDDAEKVVQQLAGVRVVKNEIVVKPPQTVAPTDVLHAIHRALARRAEREYARIQVEAQDGVVTLSGPCRSWGERNVIVGAARGTAGVCSVRDEMRIEQ